MPLPCVRIVPPQRRGPAQPKTNNCSRRPEGGVLPLRRTSSVRLRIFTRSLSLDTQHRPWETAHVRKTRNEIAPGGRQGNLFSSPARSESLHGSQLQIKRISTTPPADSGNAAVSSHPPLQTLPAEQIESPAKLDQTTTQFTNLRTLTLFTRPNIRNVDQMLDPP
jgi:hypothetical protein